MEYSFDTNGWYTDLLLPDRVTDIEPPAHGDRDIGKPYPNFTGYKWIWLDYIEPVPIVVEEPIPDPIIQYKTILTPYEFKSRFTSSERIAARVLARIDDELDDLWDMLASAQEVNLDDPLLIYGLPLLVLKEVITQERCDEILTKYPIPS